MTDTHPHPAETSAGVHLRFGLAVVLTVAIVVGEVIAGAIADSLALLTDAAHNLTDVGALAITWYALRLARQPAHAGKTFGYHRVGILAALLNSCTLVVISLGIFYEAYQRLRTPPEVMADLMIVTGSGAVILNLLTAWLVSQGADADLNIRSAFLHLLGDVFSTLGAVLAGIGIRLTGLNWLDPAVSILIGTLILWNAWLIVTETLGILLEGTPRDIEMSVMVRDILQVEGVRGVHDLHVWAISQNLRMLSAHIVVDDMPVSQTALIQKQINELIGHRYGIHHSTLQVECQGCTPDHLYCDIHRHRPQAHHHH